MPRPAVVLPERHLRDISSSVSHIVGAAGSFVASVVLLALCDGSWRAIAGFSVFGFTMTLLYVASSVYHVTLHPEFSTTKLLKFDHIAIYVMIAGGYTPVCLIALRESSAGWLLLTASWGVVVLGTFLKIAHFEDMARVSTFLYLLMGWMSALVVVPLWRALGATGFLLLLAGGLCYTIGALVYHFEKPDPWPRIMGHHEIFHLFILAGSVCHFVLMFGPVRQLAG